MHRHRPRDPDPARAVIDSARVTLIAAPRARGSASDEHAGSGVSQAHQPPSSTERPLRAWQRSALARYLAAAPQDFLAVATPGAGKTAFALRVASELLADRVIDAITVVTPTEHLKTQWSLAAASVGIAIDPDFRNSTGATASRWWVFQPPTVNTTSLPAQPRYPCAPPAKARTSCGAPSAAVNCVWTRA